MFGSLLFSLWLGATPVAEMNHQLLADVVRSLPIPGSSSGGGAAVGNDNTWTGAQTFRDNKFTITDDADTTKAMVFQLSGIGTGQTRTLTIQDGNGTVAGTNLANAWAVTQTVATDNTIDLGATAARWRELFSRKLTWGSDATNGCSFTYSGTSVDLACGEGTFLYWQSSVTQQTFVATGSRTAPLYSGANGTNSGMYFVSNSPSFVSSGSASGMIAMIGQRKTGITDNTATTIFTEAVGSAGLTKSGDVSYTVEVLDAANEVQVEIGRIFYVARNGNTGGVVCTATEVAGSVNVQSAGTHTVAWTGTVNGTNCDFQLTSDTSLTATSHRVTYTFLNRYGSNSDPTIN